ncbi:hypothetical protein [Aeromicrobium sp. Leaf350]|uniref:hypothetical protein n=1 Tax=Aeromicrobium sp. Leaf350 TaxID=2876565 RepID=UPI001E29D8A6|nr:hypothetical protein [Aeromicrobium sp. Leaf350]
MKLNVAQRVAAAGGVFALVAIASSAVAFDGESPDSGGPDTVVAASEQEPSPPIEKTAGSLLCEADEVPDLIVERFPDDKTPGAATVLEALREIVPEATADTIIETPFGPASKRAPVWVEHAGGTYVVDQAPAGGWFASKATLNGCNDLSSFKQLDSTSALP